MRCLQTSRQSQTFAAVGISARRKRRAGHRPVARKPVENSSLSWGAGPFSGSLVLKARLPALAGGLLGKALEVALEAVPATELNVEFAEELPISYASRRRSLGPSCGLDSQYYVDPGIQRRSVCLTVECVEIAFGCHDMVGVERGR